MTGIKVITGKAGQGFKLEGITLSEFEARKEDVIDLDDIDYIEMENGVIIMTDCEDGANTITPSLSNDDTEYMKRILNENGHLTLVHSYSGGITCDKNGVALTFYKDEDGKEVTVLQSEFIEDADGLEIENEYYVPFLAEHMQVVQHLPRYNTQEGAYDPEGYHNLYMDTTTYYVTDSWGNPISVPDAILETILNNLKVVKG